MRFAKLVADVTDEIVFRQVDYTLEELDYTKAQIGRYLSQLAKSATLQMSGMDTHLNRVIVYLEDASEENKEVVLQYIENPDTVHFVEAKITITDQSAFGVGQQINNDNNNILW